MIDLNELERRVQVYVDENFLPPVEPSQMADVVFSLLRRDYCLDPSVVDFLARREEIYQETFSEMLLRLIDESGEENSAVYNRARIDRRHFSKIANQKNYRPSKQTVLAFAIALKLDFERTRQLLNAAGLSLTNSDLSDVIVSYFIEHEIFDVDLVNEILYKYEQPLLGG